MKQIEGRVAVVTGAGSGIGQAVSVELARRGANIALVDIDEARLAEVKTAIEALGRNASLHVVDVSSKEQMAALPEQVLAEHGAVHILVNNAGVAVNLPFEQQDVSRPGMDIGDQLLGGDVRLQVFPSLSTRSGPGPHRKHVQLGGPHRYAGTKLLCGHQVCRAAGLSESLYVELANSSVGITCVHPGAVATNILAAARMDPTHKEKMLKMFHLAMPAEKAARLIVKAIEKNRFKLVFCVDSRVLDFMKRLFPTGTLKLMRLASRPEA